MRPQFDEKDEAIRQRYLADWFKVAGPRVGDFVIMPEGDTRRFTHHWGDSIQTTCKGQNGSFYFFGTCCSYSGSLDPAIPIARLVDTGETQEGRAWFFHHAQAGADRGVYFTIPCRVYRYEKQEG